MNILIIAYYYPPLNSGGTLRPFQMAKHLPKYGHNVTVLTHTYGRNNTDGAGSDNPRIIRIHDISHNWDRKGIRKKLQWLILRLFTEALNKLGIYHSIYSWWKQNAIKLSNTFIPQIKPDIIIATYPPVETLEIGIFLSKKHNIPLMSDFRDGLIFDPIERKRMDRYACIRNKYKEIEKDAVESSVAITTIAELITRYFRETYHPPIAEVISNAFDPNDLNDLPQDVSFELTQGDSENSQNSTQKHFHIVYTGRFSLGYEYNRVDFFFNAVRSLIGKKPHLANVIRIHLIGEYRKEELLELKDLMDRNIVICHGFVERRRSLAFQKAADLLLIITAPHRKSWTSGKIFEYMYSGKPILALTTGNVLEGIINETKTGWNVHPQHPDEIASLLEKIVEDSDFYHSIHPDQNKIQEYSIQSQMDKLNHLLQRIK